MIFAREVFPDYQTSRHLAQLSAHLACAADRSIRRLIVSMPPRHGKSLLASVLFPAWYLGRYPDRRIILVSYAASLALHFSRLSRAIVDSDAYRRIFPGVELDPQRCSAEEWNLRHRWGGLKAVGVGGPITGHGADLLIIDDPIKNREEADSETIRQSLWDWYTSTAYTRLEVDGVVIVIMSRWHDDDLAGRLLATEKLGENVYRWHVLNMPALNEQGEPLWPEKFSVDDLERIRTNIGSRDWEAMYQGRPRPPEGAVFKREWFRIVPRAPEALRWARYWDLATSTRTSSDYTASAAVAIAEDGTIYVRDMVRGRWEWPATRKIITQTAQHEQGVEVGIEKAGFQLAAVQDLRRDPALAGTTLREVAVDKDKLSRALPWAARAEAGKLALVSGTWIMGFIAECLAFPVGSHDDQVDAVSGGVQMLAARRAFTVY